MKSLDPWDPIVVDALGDVVWPQAHYGHPFYREVPSWIHYGDARDEGTQRLLFDGAFIGADAAPAGGTQMPETTMKSTVYAGCPLPGSYYMGAETPPFVPPAVPSSVPEPRKGLLAEVAPHVAPATGPISVKKELDGRQVLHVEICVDDRCYRTSMDLAPAIELVMTKLAEWHKAQHAATGQLPATTVIVGAVEDAIDAAGDAMADTLVCHHVNVMMGGFFDDVGSALGETLRELGPVITTVATSVATYYGGSTAGAVAGQLAPVVTNLHANILDPKGNPRQKAAAQQTLQRVSQEYQANPQSAQALDAANRAVRDTTVAYHVKQAVDRAVAGDSTARREVTAVVQAAEKGDPAARSTYEVIAQALLDKVQHSAWGAQLWQRITGQHSTSATATAGWHAPVVVGGFWDDVGDAILTVTGTKATNQFIHDHGLEPYVKFASQAVATYYGGPAAGAAAGAISPMVMRLGVEDKNKAAAAQRDVQGVTAAAQQHSPQMAQAVDVAKGSIRGTATAYRIDHLLKVAKGGDARAQRALAQLRMLAGVGEPNARKALQAVNAIHQEQEQARTSVSGWYDIGSAMIGALGV